MFLADTNIFLEILLKQDKGEDCKKFLNDNVGNIHITDFSLHSIGVILFKYDKQNIFQKFVEDAMPNTKFLSLPVDLYREVVNTRKSLNLDFDDAYQYSIAKHYSLKVVTMDRDFEGIKGGYFVFIGRHIEWIKSEGF